MSDEADARGPIPSATWVEIPEAAEVVILPDGTETRCVVATSAWRGGPPIRVLVDEAGIVFYEIRTHGRWRPATIKESAYIADMIAWVKDESPERPAIPPTRYPDG